MQNKFGGFSTIDLRASLHDITQHDMYAVHVWMSLLRAVDLEIFMCAAFVVTTQLLANYTRANGYWGVLWTCTVAQLSDTDNYELSRVYHESPLALLYKNTIP